MNDLRGHDFRAAVQPPAVARAGKFLQGPRGRTPSGTPARYGPAGRTLRQWSRCSRRNDFPSEWHFHSIPFSPIRFRRATSSGVPRPWSEGAWRLQASAGPGFRARSRQATDNPRGGDAASREKGELGRALGGGARYSTVQTGGALRGAGLEHTGIAFGSPFHLARLAAIRPSADAVAGDRLEDVVAQGW